MVLTIAVVGVIKYNCIVGKLHVIRQLKQWAPIAVNIRRVFKYIVKSNATVADAENQEN
jgi:hypothetical protein